MRLQPKVIFKSNPTTVQVVVALWLTSSLSERTCPSNQILSSKNGRLFRWAIMGKETQNTLFHWRWKKKQAGAELGQAHAQFPLCFV